MEQPADGFARAPVAAVAAAAAAAPPEEAAPPPTPAPAAPPEEALRRTPLAQPTSQQQTPLEDAPPLSQKASGPGVKPKESRGEAFRGLAFTFGVLRVGAVVWWLFQPIQWAAPFSNWLWPILGIVFVPATTMAFVLVSPGGVAGWDWLWLGWALLTDLGLALALTMTSMPDRSGFGAKDSTH